MSVIDAAKAAQRARIKAWLKLNYVGGRKAIGHWNDHYFSLSRFSASCLARVSGVSSDHARRRLDKLARADGVVERFKESYGPVSYRFSRVVCDIMAEEVTRELLAEGLPMDAVRS